jgi:hypothetical protein
MFFGGYMANTPIPARKLIVERSTDGSFTLKREGGGPSFTLYPKEVADIKAGTYDPPHKATK